MPATPDTDDLHHRIYVSVVSHGHEKHIIETLQPASWIAETTSVVPLVLSNLPSPQLRQYCQESGILYLENSEPLGFGANNNKAFRHLESKFGVSDQDFFFTINPDIQTSGRDIEAMARKMEQEGLKIAAPNLVNQENVPEDNIRSYPSLIDCILRFTLGSERSCVSKAEIQSTRETDWAAGAFLGFSVNAYRAVNGFDERYFMYYEDADICRRARQQGIGTYYLPTISATHLAARDSRKLFSRQLIWHVTSALRFTLTRSSS
ncbi:glycosyltransferase [Microbulbifer sp. YPW16]|uniref:glycosyltransferase n=1 Tax=Microbulbifer sp. YPW16 TaxID=2904242 RepID=UPI001E39DFF5|nr:glycosyltransferase family 2 protein [Microbulbifer sp. YPW16]UHQ55856.1 glycosyltransferase family 2 protein [Microbulbifer sp. YPW16]